MEATLAGDVEEACRVATEHIQRTSAVIEALTEDATNSAE